MSKSLEFAPAALLAALLTAAPIAGAAAADKYGLGRPATPAEISAWDIDVRPDGLGLPEGSGSVMDGEGIFTEKCAACHGDFGEAVGRWPELAGGFGTLTQEDPVKTVGSYWPYLSTVWDYVHRAMPFGDAQSLTNDEVYALTAYVLYLNDLADEDFVLTRESFGEIEMPNADGFFMDNRAEAEYPKLSGEACMSDCKNDVEITLRARVLDVTPETDEPGEPEADAAAAPVEDAQEVAPVLPDEDQAANDQAAAPVQVAAAEAAPDPELVADGEKVFRKCKACHQVGEDAANRVGPQLNGIMGRVAGSLDGYRYSKAFKEAHDAGLVWDREALSAFLKDPKGYLKGTKMAFAGLKKDKDIDALIAYLRDAGE